MEVQVKKQPRDQTKHHQVCVCVALCPTLHTSHNSYLLLLDAYAIVPPGLLSLTKTSHKELICTPQGPARRMSSNNKTFFYFKGNEPTELILTNFDNDVTMTIPEGGDQLPDLYSDLSSCIIAPYKNVLVAHGCIKKDKAYEKGHYWTKGLPRWMEFGDSWTSEEESVYKYQLQPSGIILNEDEFYFFGGVSTQAWLAESTGWMCCTLNWRAQQYFCFQAGSPSAANSTTWQP